MLPIMKVEVKSQMECRALVIQWWPNGSWRRVDFWILTHEVGMVRFQVNERRYLKNRSSRDDAGSIL